MTNIKQYSNSLAAFIVLALFGTTLLAHDGRRYEIKVIDNQLFGLGYIGGGVDDGGGVVRPYYNSIHDHWTNNGDGTATSIAPGFDLFDYEPLEGCDLTINLLGGSKWVDPPHMPAAGTVPNLVALDADEEITAEFVDGTTASTSSPGRFLFSPDVDQHGLFDLHFEFNIAQEPSDVIYVLEWRMDTGCADIESSETLYTIFSPDGSNPIDREHHASLYLESYLGLRVGVPEPTSGMLLVSLFGIVALRRRRSI